jgi:hypothetical protein
MAGEHQTHDDYMTIGPTWSPKTTRVRGIWERFLDDELGHVRFVARLFEETEGRDAAEVLPERLPEPIRYTSHREFVRHPHRATPGPWPRCVSPVRRTAKAARLYEALIRAPTSCNHCKPSSWPSSPTTSAGRCLPSWPSRPC